VVLVVVPQEYLLFLKAICINLPIGTIAIAAHTSAPPQSALLRFPTELKLALGLVLCAAISIPGSYWRSASVDAFSEYLRVIAVFWLVGQDFCSISRLRVLFWTLILVCLPLVLVALYNYQAGVHLGMGRIAGYSNNLAENPNDLALTLNMFMPMAVVLAWTARRQAARWTARVMIALAVGAVMVTFSRGGFLTLVIEAALFVHLFAKRRGAKVLVAVAVVAAVAFAMMPAGYSDRLSTIVDIEADQTGSAQMRLGDTIASIEYMLTHPIVGAGLGQGLLALNELRGALWTTVHNAYLNYGVDLGLIGFLVFVTMVVTTYRSVRFVERLPASAAVPAELRWMASGVRISLAGFMVAAFFHPIGYDFYFFYLAGMAVALKTTAARQFGVRVPA
jgi:O-antigen ligase